MLAERGVFVRPATTVAIILLLLMILAAALLQFLFAAN